MTTTARLPLVDQLQDRLVSLPDHPAFVGTALDLSELDGLQLGIVWPALLRAERLDYDDPRAAHARWLRQQLDVLALSPLLDEASSLAVFSEIEAGRWQLALRELPHLAQPPSRALQQQLARILSVKPQGYGPGDAYQAFALCRFAGNAGLDELQAELRAQYQDSPYRLLELDLLSELSTEALLALAGTRNGFFAAASLGFTQDDPAPLLAEELAYVEFACEVLQQAVQRVADIQSGAVPYVADGAFTVDDAQVISRAARIAAYRDEVWFRELIGPLLLGVCVAPTAAKTTPSQSLAITLGHSIETIPTPESVRALREALAAVRHAGIEKKLTRNLKPAERALGERPSTALRMTLGAKPDKKQQTMLASCLEAGFWQGMVLSHAEWRERLVDAPAAIAFSTGVVWLAQAANGSQQALMVEAPKAGIRLRGLDGAHCVLAEDCTIRLWHPLLATPAERHAWQQALLARKVKQPIRQVFREYYVASTEAGDSTSSAMFEGHILALRPLIGLARKEGWMIRQYEGLVRQFGEIRARFAISADLYPGASGHGTSGLLYLERKAGRHWVAMPIDQVDPVVYSEIARAADLLVSVAGFAVADEASKQVITTADLGLSVTGSAVPIISTYHPSAARWQHLEHLAKLPLGILSANRRNTLAMVFAKQIESGQIVVDERHLRIGDYAVHIATARVTRAGEPIEVELQPAGAQLAAVPWLPYDEVLLQRIVDKAVALLA